jgi:hypothetical protein
MPPSAVEPPFDQFLVTAEAVAHDPEAASAAYLMAAAIFQL